MRPRVGVLAVQGNFREHAAMLGKLGAKVIEVRKPEELAGLDGLVVPGGDDQQLSVLEIGGAGERVGRGDQLLQPVAVASHRFVRAADVLDAVVVGGGVAHGG